MLPGQVSELRGSQRWHSYTQGAGAAHSQALAQTTRPLLGPSPNSQYQGFLLSSFTSLSHIHCCPWAPRRPNRSSRNHPALADLPSPKPRSINKAASYRTRTRCQNCAEYFTCIPSRMLFGGPEDRHCSYSHFTA